MSNRVLEPFEALMKVLRAGMKREGLTLAEVMAFRRLAEVERELLGPVIDADQDAQLSGGPFQALVGHDETDPGDEAPDYYQRRDELRSGQIFRTCGGDIVKLGRRLPGDGTDWLVEHWYDGWSGEESRIHPGDLSQQLPNNCMTEPASLPSSFRTP